MMENPKTENCMMCGAALEYSNEAQTLLCSCCGKTSAGHIRCPVGHYICDACHKLEAVKAVETVVFSTSEKAPHHIAELLMSHPALPLLGCEHAFIAAGALAAALKNSRYTKIADQDIREVFTRTAAQAIGGYCGLTGVCGISPAIGACFSVFLGAHCGSDSEQKIVMEAVIRVSRAIADLTGPSCCKAYVRAALGSAVEIFGERFGIVLPASPSVECRHDGKHAHGCREQKCPYFRKKTKDVFADSRNPASPPGSC